MGVGAGIKGNVFTLLTSLLVLTTGVSRFQGAYLFKKQFYFLMAVLEVKLRVLPMLGPSSS